MPITTAAYSLTTPERIKSRLQIDAAVTTWDVILSGMVVAVTEFIESQCDRRFLRATYTQQLYSGSLPDGTPRQYLQLKSFPLVSISSFQYRTGSKTSPTWVDFQADGYQESLPSGIIRTSLPAGYENIRITYIGGYLIDFATEFTPATHTLPHEISDLAERLCTKLFKKREAEGKTSESFQQSSISWGDFLEDHDKAIIANYRCYSFA